MRWRRARGRRSLSTGTMFNTQITLRKNIVWAEVVGFGFPSFILWESCFQQIPVASRSHSESSHLPHGFISPLSETLRSWRACLHLLNLLWTKLVYLSRAMNTDILRFSVLTLLSEMSTSLWFVHSDVFFKGNVTFQLRETWRTGFSQWVLLSSWF